MSEEMFKTAYESWTESDVYRKQSPMENEIYTKNETEIVSIIGKEKFGEVYDFIISLASESEDIAFREGFRRGMLFMTDVMKGGVSNA